jgi:aquaporin Z
MNANRSHWPEYLIEALALGTFMLVACAAGTLLGHPTSPVYRALGGGVAQRVVMGLCMGLTAVAIIYSPWGRRSGAHMNPALTLTFLRLGKVARRDALAYVAAQFTGGVLGVLAAHRLIGAALGDPAVHFVVTRPGPGGVVYAFAGEVLITFVLLSVVLRAQASARWSRFTGVFAGVLVAAYITLESPVSGMSMNPARSFGSAFAAGDWTALWLYFVAPPLGMLLAAQLYVARRGVRAVACPKMAHAEPCLFCEHAAREAARETAGTIGADARLQPATSDTLGHTLPRGRPWRTTPTTTSSSSAAAPAAARSPTASHPPASAS